MSAMDESKSLMSQNEADVSSLSVASDTGNQRSTTNIHKRRRTSINADSVDEFNDWSTRFTLDIGGIIFVTTLRTLHRVPDTYFQSVIQWHSDSHASNDSGNDGDYHSQPQSTSLSPPATNISSLFVDRDPTLFRHILNYLRDGFFPVLMSDSELESLHHEAEFYSIQPLVELIEKRRNERALFEEANQARLAGNKGDERSERSSLAMSGASSSSSVSANARTPLRSSAPLLAEFVLDEAF